MSEWFSFVLTRGFWGLEANHAILITEIYISILDLSDNHGYIFDRLLTEKER